MTQEALKMALEALELSAVTVDSFGVQKKTNDAITAIKQALAKEKALQALHNENERLGLYKNAYAQPEQEPVAWRTFDGEGGYDYRSYEDNESYADEWDKRNPNHKGWVDKLYTAAPQRKPCPTCEALARTVMMDQTGRDA